MRVLQAVTASGLGRSGHVLVSLFPHAVPAHESGAVQRQRRRSGVLLIGAGARATQKQLKHSLSSRTVANAGGLLAHDLGSLTVLQEKATSGLDLVDVYGVTEAPAAPRIDLSRASPALEAKLSQLRGLVRGQSGWAEWRGPGPCQVCGTAVERKEQGGHRLCWGCAVAHVPWTAVVRAERLQRGGALGQCVWVAGGGLICECMEPKWTGV